MKTKYRLIFFLSMWINGSLFSQEFQTTFYLIKSDGSQDSVTIGYDPNAADGIDPALGEVNILSLPMLDFELRAGQVYNERMTFFEDLEHPMLDSLAQYTGKTEIMPKECLSFIPVSNQAGFLASINLFIKTDFYPVMLKWDKNAFANACLSMSFITDWPITTWWDIPCCNTLEFGEIGLVDRDSIILNTHSGINLTDQLGDTLTMLTILLADEFGTSTTDVDKILEPKSFPNPSNGSLTIPTDWKLMSISNLTGTKIDFEMNGSTLFTNFEGIIFLTLQKGSKIVVLKHVNNVR